MTSSNLFRLTMMLASFFLAAVISVYAEESVTIDYPKRNLGVLDFPTSNILHVVFPVQNTTRNPLTIEISGRSCTCASSFLSQVDKKDLSAIELDPVGTLEVSPNNVIYHHLVVDLTNESPGRKYYASALRVRETGKLHPCEVEAILEGPVFQPPDLRFTFSEDSGTPRFPLALKCSNFTTKTLISLNRVTIDDPRFIVTDYEKSKTGEWVKCQIECKNKRDIVADFKDAKDSTIKSFVRIAGTANENEFEVVRRIRFSLIPAMQCSLKSIFVSTFTKPSLREGVTIMVRSNRAFGIENIEDPKKLFSFEWNKDETSDVLRILVKLNEKRLDDGDIPRDYAIIIHSSSGNVSLPVQIALP